MKKTLAIILALVLVLSLATTAFAQQVDVNSADAGKITIANAAKGETYAIYKLFDATVTGDEDGSIAYTGDIPDSLSAYFTADTKGNVTATEAAWTETNGVKEMSAGLKAALTEWAKTATKTAETESDGSALEFINLDYGYYVVTTTQGEQIISVDSTNPNATIYDKNSVTPSATKAAQDDNVAIGDTVTYSLTFNTANYVGEGENAKQVVKYVIKDTLPAFLTNVNVTAVTVDNAAYLVGNAVPQFDSNGEITIPWVDADGKSLYTNGADVTVTYTAVVTSSAVVDGEGNKNEVTLTPYTDENTPWEETWKAEDVIYTYAAALEKVDENKDPLAGAKFKAMGLTVTGSNGYYTVVSYDRDSKEYGTEMECDDQGNLVIVGLPTDESLTLMETVAPDGYNILTYTVSLTATKISETVSVSSTTVYYDADGKVTEEVTESSTTTISYNEALKTAAIEIVNNKGAELPTTGGIGTTLFYIFGGILVVGAVVLLVTKKRMSVN